MRAASWRLSDREKARACALYLGGVKLSRIGAEFEVTPANVISIVKRRGFKLRRETREKANVTPSQLHGEYRSAERAMAEREFVAATKDLQDLLFEMRGAEARAKRAARRLSIVSEAKRK